MIGTAKVMSYDNIVKAQKKRDSKGSGRTANCKCLGRSFDQRIRSMLKKRKGPKKK
jgi:hypothetical protein